MTKYRKKPVVIEAVKLGWDTWNEICEFVSPEYFDRGVYLDDETKEVLPEGKTSNTIGLVIKTLEGNHLAVQGDYIIKGIKGEFYPCKPDIFEATYEMVEKESEVEEGGERIMKLLYVRFGEIPTNGKSKNYLTGEYEKGVSVYEALERDEKMLILLPNLTGSACVTLSGVLDRPMFIVDGELCGTGSDGEPLLKNCKIVREIKNINHSRGW